MQQRVVCFKFKKEASEKDIEQHFNDFASLKNNRHCWDKVLVIDGRIDK